MAPLPPPSLFIAEGIELPPRVWATGPPCQMQSVWPPAAHAANAKLTGYGNRLWIAGGDQMRA